MLTPPCTDPLDLILPWINREAVNTEELIRLVARELGCSLTESLKQLRERGWVDPPAPRKPRQYKPPVQPKRAPDRIIALARSYSTERQSPNG